MLCIPIIRCITEKPMTPETEGNEEKGPNGLPYVNDPGKHPQHDDADEASPDDPDIAGMDGSEEPE